MPIDETPAAEIFILERTAVVDMLKPGKATFGCKAAYASSWEAPTAN